MGYSNDQFYNLPNSEQNIRRGSPLAGTVKSNKKFDYPSNKIRTVSRNPSGDLLITTRELKKGYIRNFKTTYQSGIETAVTPLVRCDFQFNPTSLQQAVSMRTDVLNIFQQSPVEITQPLASQTQFAFQLLFDRSYTYNNESDEAVSEQSLGNYDLPNIGVLHDIRLLYSIIGQGINEDMVAAALNSARNTIIAEQMSENALNEEAGGTTTEVSVPVDFDDKAGTYFNANVGNSGFLIPLPVRVVFSSLYMVDGYVTSSSIVFSKFSSTYVPLQCMVNLEMQALYIGFAKERTFLTTNLDEATKEIEQRVEDAKNAVEAASSILPNYRPKLKYRIRSKGSKPKYTDKYLAYLVDAETGEEEGSEKIEKRYVNLSIESDTENDPIDTLLINNSTATAVSIIFSVNFYKCNNSITQNALVELFKTDADVTTEEIEAVGTGVQLVSQSSVTHVITSSSEWRALLRINTSPSNNDYDFSYSSHTAAESPGNIEYMFDDENGRFGFFVNKPEASLVVSLGAGAATYTYRFNPFIGEGNAGSTLGEATVSSQLIVGP